VLFEEEITGNSDGDDGDEEEEDSDNVVSTSI
jgi:hypothetical protein